MIDGIKSFFHIGNTPPAPPPPPPPPPEPAANNAPAAPAAAPTPASLPPTHTSQEARDRANALFFQGPNAADAHQHTDPTLGREYGNITREANPIAGAHSHEQDLEAVRQVAANQGQVDGVVATMTPEQQQQFHALEQQFEHNPAPDGNPRAQLSLQLLALEGRLTDPHQTSSTGQNLLQALSDANGAPVDTANGLNHDQLMGEMVQEIANPSTIAQGDKNTCTVTGLQIMTATQRPAEYVRIVSALAAPTRPEGGYAPVTLADGHTTITRAPGCEQPESQFDPHAHVRTSSSRLWQSSMMELAAQDIQHAQDPHGQQHLALHYDPIFDQIADDHGHKIGGQSTIEGGIPEWTFAQVAGAVQGQNIQSVHADTLAGNLHGVIDDKLHHGPVSGQMFLGDFGPNGQRPDSVQVTIRSAGHDRYSVDDGHGHHVTMSGAELERRIDGVDGQTGPNPLYSQTAMAHDMRAEIRTELAAGRTPSVALAWGNVDANGTTHGGHQVLVTGFDATTNEYIITNPHGDEERMAAAEFEARMRGMIYPQQQAPAH